MTLMACDLQSAGGKWKRIAEILLYRPIQTRQGGISKQRIRKNLRRSTTRAGRALSFRKGQDRLLRGVRVRLGPPASIVHLWDRGFVFDVQTFIDCPGTSRQCLMPLSAKIHKCIIRPRCSMTTNVCWEEVLARGTRT